MFSLFSHKSRQCRRLAFRAQRRRLSREYGARLYERALRASREERLFSDCSLADTADGRLDSLTLHLYLYMERFSSPLHEPVLRSMMEFFVRDLEHALRELGTSDLRVGKKVRQVLLRVYGAFRVYGSASDDRQWREALSRNILDCDSKALCLYRADFSKRLARQPLREVIGGRLRCKQ